MAKIIRLVELEASKLIEVGDIIQDSEGKYLMITDITETPGPLNSKTKELLNVKDIRADLEKLHEAHINERWYEYLEILDAIIERLTYMRDVNREALEKLVAEKAGKK